MATLKDVARECGLSLPTVSQIFGKRSCKFSEETRQRVFETAKRIGFKRHTGATNLANGKTNNIFVIMQGSNNLATPRIDGFLGLTDAAAEKSLQVSLACVKDDFMKDPFVRRILSERICDGVIFNSVCPDEEADAIEALFKKEGVPLVWLNLKRPLNAVCPDEEAAAKILARRLIEHGHKNVMYFGASATATHFSAALRPAALERELLALGGGELRKIDSWSSSADFAAKALAFFREPGDVSAAVFYSDSNFLRLSMLADEAGSRFPGRFSLAVFDAPSSYSSTTARVRLESAPPDFRSMSAKALELLHSRIEAGGADAPSVFMPPLHCEGETLFQAKRG